MHSIYGCTRVSESVCVIVCAYACGVFEAISECVQSFQNVHQYSMKSFYPWLWSFMFTYFASLGFSAVYLRCFLIIV